MRGGECHWSTYQQPNPSSQHWRMQERYGIRSGACFINSSSRSNDKFLVVRLASPTPQLTSAQQDFIEQLAPYLARLIDRDWFRSSPDISARQLEIGQMLRDGLTARQVASRLHIPLRAVRHHMNRLAAELGLGSARTNPEAIVVALEHLAALPDAS